MWSSLRLYQRFWRTCDTNTPPPLVPFSYRSRGNQPTASEGDAETVARAQKAANAPLRRRPKERRSSPTGEPVSLLSTPPGDDQSPVAAPAAYGRAGVSGDDRGPKKRVVRPGDRMDVDSPRSTPPSHRSPPPERNRRDRQDGNAGSTPHSQQAPPQQNRRQSLPGSRTEAPPPSTQRPQPTQRVQPNPPTQALRSQAANNTPAASTGLARPRQRPASSSASETNRRGGAGAPAWSPGSANAGSAAAAGGGDAGPGGASAFRPHTITVSASSTSSSSNSAAHVAAASVREWAPPLPVDVAFPIHNAAALLAARRESGGAVALGTQYIPGGQGHQEATRRKRTGQVPRFIPGRGNPSTERGGSSPRSPPGSAAGFRPRAHYNAPASRQQRAEDDHWARANRLPSNTSSGDERGGSGRRRRGPEYR